MRIYEDPLNTLMIELPEKIFLVADFLEDDIHSNHGIQYLDTVLNE
ncbi:Protein of unknown function [Bacillus cytotoxicus]|uniref:Uncharacterized protein n=1 Tax=Bacillus cytotoxicus TaxID=580165 RepID=A0AAX2CE82_9BACI|nr:Protein of unknown function [Bacillus cytotoxicus]